MLNLNVHENKKHMKSWVCSLSSPNSGTITLGISNCLLGKPHYHLPPPIHKHTRAHTHMHTRRQRKAPFKIQSFQIGFLKEASPLSSPINLFYFKKAWSQTVLAGACDMRPMHILLSKHFQAQ